MYKLGEYTIASKFPNLQQNFSIEFYGATGKGNLLIDVFKEDGTILSSVTLQNVTNGPYYFSTTSAIIAGFSIYNSEIGGLAIYEIGYKTPNVAPGFLDTYTGPVETLDVHVSDSGHTYEIIWPRDYSSAEPYPSDYTLDGNGAMYCAIQDGLAYISTNWRPQTTSWYLEVIFDKNLSIGEAFELGMKVEDSYFSGPIIQFYSSGYYISSNDGDFIYWGDEITFPNQTDVKVRMEIIEQKNIKIYVNDVLQYDSTNTDGPFNFLFSVTRMHIFFDDILVATPKHLLVKNVIANDLEPVEYIPNKFAAVASQEDYQVWTGSMLIMTSKTGDIWSYNRYYDDEIESGDEDFRSISYGNGLFVAVSSNPSSEGNQVVVSADGGDTWTRKFGSPTNYYFRQIDFCKDIFIACENEEYYQVSNTIAKTSDGENWTTQTISGGPWFAAAYGNNTFVLVGNGTAGSRAAYSSDGSNWTITSTLASNDGNWHKVKWCKDRFIALSYSQGYTNAQMMSSTDGITWTVVTLPVAAETVQWQDVIYANNIFVAVGCDLWDNYSNSAFKEAVMTSTDGENWTIRSTPTYGSWKSIAYGNGKFVAVADASDGVYHYDTALSLLITSTDGINWTMGKPSCNNCWCAIASTG